MSRLQLKCDGTRWGRERKFSGNWRMEWVASTLHTASEHGVSSITPADVHTSAASSRLNWRPRRFKWTRPFRRKTKSGFCACAITFQLASIARPLFSPPPPRATTARYGATFPPVPQILNTVHRAGAILSMNIRQSQSLLQLNLNSSPLCTPDKFLCFQYNRILIISLP